MPLLAPNTSFYFDCSVTQVDALRSAVAKATAILGEIGEGIPKRIPKSTKSSSLSGSADQSAEGDYEQILKILKGWWGNSPCGEFYDRWQHRRIVNNIQKVEGGHGNLSSYGGANQDERGKPETPKGGAEEQKTPGGGGGVEVTAIDEQEGDEQENGGEKLAKVASVLGGKLKNLGKRVASGLKNLGEGKTSHHNAFESDVFHEKAPTPDEIDDLVCGRDLVNGNYKKKLELVYNKGRNKWYMCCSSIGDGSSLSLSETEGHPLSSFFREKRREFTAKEAAEKEKGGGRELESLRRGERKTVGEEGTEGEVRKGGGKGGLKGGTSKGQESGKSPPEGGTNPAESVEGKNPNVGQLFFTNPKTAHAMRKKFQEDSLYTDSLVSNGGRFLDTMHCQEIETARQPSSDSNSVFCFQVVYY